MLPVKVDEKVEKVQWNGNADEEVEQAVLLETEEMVFLSPFLAVAFNLISENQRDCTGEDEQVKDGDKGSREGPHSLHRSVCEWVVVVPPGINYKIEVDCNDDSNAGDSNKSQIDVCLCGEGMKRAIRGGRVRESESDT